MGLFAFPFEHYYCGMTRCYDVRIGYFECLFMNSAIGTLIIMAHQKKFQEVPRCPKIDIVIWIVFTNFIGLDACTQNYGQQHSTINKRMPTDQHNGEYFDGIR